MPLEPWMLLAGNEVAGIAGLAGVVVVSNTAIFYKMLDTMRIRDEQHTRERQLDREVLDKLVVAQHAAVDALQRGLEALSPR